MPKILGLQGKKSFSLVDEIIEWMNKFFHFEYYIYYRMYEKKDTLVIAVSKSKHSIFLYNDFEFAFFSSV